MTGHEKAGIFWFYNQQILFCTIKGTTTIPQLQATRKNFRPEKNDGRNFSDKKNLRLKNFGRKNN
jgi:hypothetical protein